MAKPRILLWDIETSQHLVLTHGTRKQYINFEDVVIGKYIFCISYCWYPQTRVHTISILDAPERFKENKHDDFHVVKEFSKVIAGADAHVAHYGDGFDMPILQGRMLFNGLLPLPKIKSLDTCKIAKKYFKLSYYKLDYLAKSLGYKGKIENPRNLWQNCFNGNIKALKHMIKYNKQDVVALRYVFEKLMPYVKDNQLNANMFGDGDRCANPVCGSYDLERRGFNYTRIGKYQRYQCRDCGSWSDERHTRKTAVLK